MKEKNLSEHLFYIDGTKGMYVQRLFQQLFDYSTCMMYCYISAFIKTGLSGAI